MREVTGYGFTGYKCTGCGLMMLTSVASKMEFMMTEVLFLTMAMVLELISMSCAWPAMSCAWPASSRAKAAL